jgi:hypothetical protein
MRRRLELQSRVSSPVTRVGSAHPYVPRRGLRRAPEALNCPTLRRHFGLPIEESPSWSHEIRQYVLLSILRMEHGRAGLSLVIN